MSLYCIGDIQGCLTGLERLLDKIRFDPDNDQLWFAGDLVNRGPDSLGVLRCVKALGVSAEVTLGNHDLHLLAAAQGIRKPGKTLRPVLEADDCEELLDWLAQRPLLLNRAASENDPGFVLAHAGLHPDWDRSTAIACAREVELALASKATRVDFLRAMYGNLPNQWHDQLTGIDRLRCIVNIFTRMRFVDMSGCLDFEDKGPPGSQASGLMPWFYLRRRVANPFPIVFGHWSTLGQYEWPREQVFGIDTGYLWGGSLTAAEYTPEQPWKFHTVEASE